MINILLWLLAVSSSDFSLSQMSLLQAKIEISQGDVSHLPPINMQLTEIREMMQKEGYDLNPQVINKVVTTLKCATKYNVPHNNILTVIDYSLPSNQKRLWVFDLNNKKLLFHTYVSHGIRSGTLLTNYFSNKNNSKASSIGVYKTEKAYYGREGLSLQLQGLDRNFNDNAASRSVVMHGGWYVEENFIKKYGRPGRSWGCPALPLALYQPIINTIKDDSLMVMYYPSDDWFIKSKFLTCDIIGAKFYSNKLADTKPSTDTGESRDAILFADYKNNKMHSESAPVVVISADVYERIFHSQAPLSRMLRRQINNAEYIALSNKELNKIIAENNKEAISAIYFVIPNIIMVRGYYETQMKIVPMGKIKNIQVAGNSFNVTFENRTPVNLRASNEFIRWVGL